MRIEKCGSSCGPLLTNSSVACSSEPQQLCCPSCASRMPGTACRDGIADTLQDCSKLCHLLYTEHARQLCCAVLYSFMLCCAMLRCLSYVQVLGHMAGKLSVCMCNVSCSCCTVLFIHFPLKGLGPIQTQLQKEKREKKLTSFGQPATQFTSASFAVIVCSTASSHLQSSLYLCPKMSQVMYLMQQNIKGPLLLQRQGKVNGHKAKTVRGSQGQQPSGG